MFLSVTEQVEGLEARWYSCTDIPFSSTAPQAVMTLKSWGSVRKEGKGKGNGLEASCGEGGLPSVAFSHQSLATPCSGAAKGAPAGGSLSSAHIWWGGQCLGITLAFGSHSGRPLLLGDANPASTSPRVGDRSCFPLLLGSG